VSGGPTRVVKLLVMIALACRGIGYSLLTPTYEGWDEYQHVAYFEHICDRQPLPQLGKTFVSKRVMDDLVRHPVPNALASQAPESRLQSYSDYWKDPKPGDYSRVPLYEAQHGPLYYVAHGGFHALSKDSGFFASTRCLRLANVGWTLLAVALFAEVLRFRNIRPSVVNAALVLLAVHPLFLMTTARVANDAMAIALSMSAVVVAASPVGDRMGKAVGTACFLAVAGAVKATAWTLFPAVLVLYLWTQPRWSRAFAFVGTFLLIVGASMAFDVSRHGRFAPTQEAFVLAERGEGNGALLRAAAEINWFDEFSRRWGRQLLWVGGWSFAPLPKLLPRLHQWLLVASIIPLVIRLVRGGPRDRGFAAFCILACVGIATGQAIHMAQSKAALGFVATPAWYAVIALPMLLVGLAWSWNVNERVRQIAITTFFMPLLVSELIGVFFAWLPTFAGSHDPATVFERCSILAGGKVLFVVGAAGFIIGWIAAILALRSSLRKETA
jgi:hypothetical protein